MMEHTMTEKGCTKTVSFQTDTTEDDRLINPVHVKRMVDMNGQKIGRNQSCPCGSGKKFKACCLINRHTGKVEKKDDTPQLSMRGIQALTSVCGILHERGLQ